MERFGVVDGSWASEIVNGSEMLINVDGFLVRDVSFLEGIGVHIQQYICYVGSIYNYREFIVVIQPWLYEFLLNKIISTECMKRSFTKLNVQKPCPCVQTIGVSSRSWCQEFYSYMIFLLCNALSNVCVTFPSFFTYSPK